MLSPILWRGVWRGAGVPPMQTIRLQRLRDRLLPPALVTPRRDSINKIKFLKQCIKSSGFQHPELKGYLFAATSRGARVAPACGAWPNMHGGLGGRELRVFMVSS